MVLTGLTLLPRIAEALTGFYLKHKT